MNTWDKGDKIFRKQESKLYAGEAKVLRYKYMDQPKSQHAYIRDYIQQERNGSS